MHWFTDEGIRPIMAVYNSVREEDVHWLTGRKGIWPITAEDVNVGLLFLTTGHNRESPGKRKSQLRHDPHQTGLQLFL